jgi:hypothetical protein
MVIVNYYLERGERGFYRDFGDVMVRRGVGRARKDDCVSRMRSALRGFCGSDSIEEDE